MHDHAELIAALCALPDELTAAVEGLSATQLTTQFLAGEWTVAQNINHLADSHMHAFIRTKLILTEDYPTLRPYDQNIWAAQPDGMTATVAASLALLGGLQARWADMVAALDAAALERTGFHPENGDVSVANILAYYAAHGRGHIEQIQRTLAAAAW